MQQQITALRTVAATDAIGVVAATAVLIPSVPRYRGGRRDLRHRRRRGDRRISIDMKMRTRIAAALLLLALAVPASADAHAFLVSSTPDSGTSLARAPRVVTLRFTEPVSLALTRVQIFDGRGTPREGARVSEGVRANELRVVLPQLATGAYRITYSTVSQDDLHATRGAIVFGAGTAAPAARASDAPTAGTSITESVAHLFDLISLSLLIGITALLACSLPVAVRARITRFALVALPALLLAGVLALAGKSSQVPLRDALFGTPWGHAILVRELAIVTVLIALATRQRRLALALLVPVAAAEAASGHAASLGALPILTMAAHILAGCLWVGGLIVLALVLPGLERRDVLETLTRFGRLAAAGVAVVVDHRSLRRRAPGRESRCAALDDLRRIARRQARLGRRHRRSSACSDSSPCAACGRPCDCCEPRRSPPSACSSPRRSCSRALPPAARSSLPSRGPSSERTLASGSADDLLVDVSAAPNRPGQNFVTTNVLDTLRPPPAPVRRVTITFSRGAQRVTVPATRLNTGRWQVAGTQLSASGNWRIAVAVERKGMPVATYRTAWTVSSLPLPPGTHRPRHSQRPLGPILSALAIALAALFLAARPLALPRARRDTASADGVMRKALVSRRSPAPPCFRRRRWQLRRRR